MAMDAAENPGELADRAVYHFYPSLEQVREWLNQAGFSVVAEEMGNQWYHHFLAQKTAER
jgi:hypothetical protein